MPIILKWNIHISSTITIRQFRWPFPTVKIEMQSGTWSLPWGLQNEKVTDDGHRC